MINKNSQYAEQQLESAMEYWMELADKEENYPVGQLPMSISLKIHEAAINYMELYRAAYGDKSAFGFQTITAAIEFEKTTIASMQQINNQI